MTIFDASSLLNLHNGALIPVVLNIPGVSIAYGPQVRRECRTIGPELDKLVSLGSAELLSDDDLSFSRFAELLLRYQLGPGETECLVLAESLERSVCCDDSKARRMITERIGANRLTGTIGLVYSAVEQGLMTEQQARSAHSAMVARGGFLPALSLPVVATEAIAR